MRSSGARWRESLTAEQRSDALLPLQALLSGLVAFRDWENQARPGLGIDFHPHLHAVRTGYDWGLRLVAATAKQRGSAVGARWRASWRAGVFVARARAFASRCASGRRSVCWSFRVSMQATFQEACDLFLRELERNPFFQPPEPLEFSNAAELLQPEGLTPQLESWESESARTATMIAFLALLRDHRFLGIADGQLREPDGIFRSHLVDCGSPTRASSAEPFSLGAGRGNICRTSSKPGCYRWKRSRRAFTRNPGLCSTTPCPSRLSSADDALAAERMHQGIVELRHTVRDAAKKLHALGRPARAERARATERACATEPASGDLGVSPHFAGIPREGIRRLCERRPRERWRQPRFRRRVPPSLPIVWAAFEPRYEVPAPRAADAGGERAQRAPRHRRSQDRRLRPANAGCSSSTSTMRWPSYRRRRSSRSTRPRRPPSFART